MTTSMHTSILAGYDQALHDIYLRAAACTGSLFTTDADDLWEIFLANVDPDRRQHYTCNTCRSFVRRYGGLVTIDESGQQSSLLWSSAGPTYVDGLSRAFAAMARRVARAKVNGVFVTKDLLLGTPEAGGWAHFHARLHPSQRYTGILTASQRAAERAEEYGMLVRGLAEFKLDTFQQAHDLLASGQLYRSEKCSAIAEWLLGLRQMQRDTPSSRRENLLWAAVAKAPAGFCHVRSGMIGTLLEDVQSGLPFHEIKRRFDTKMHPLQYQRPSAAPSAGNIAQAERLVAELNSAGALARRFARVEEVDALWRPVEQSSAQPNGGVFGHLLPKARAATAMTLPTQTMTWVKFRDTVLPTAASIEYQVPSTVQPYVAIVTAASSDAPPIFQWDKPERRNPASWYLYHMGSTPGSWNLSPGWVKVTALTLRPCHWYGNAAPNQTAGVIAILDGCRDTRHTKGGGFFVESLRSEYHGVRRTLEAYAQQATIAGRDQATACGVSLQAGTPWSSMVFRVTSKTGTVSTYKLDRWD